ncbi:hypothetical protein D3C73_243720 [compost metagenome]
MAGDDIINAIEHGQSVMIGGTSTGMVPGVQLAISVNGQTYHASVLADGTWLTNVPAADVANWPAGAVNITVAGSSATGNPVQIGHTVTVDLAAVAVSIATVASDNVLSIVEHYQPVILNGSTQNVEAGQVVKVSFAGHSYDAVVGSDGKWTVTVPAVDMKGLADGETQVQVSVVNQAGNSVSAAQNVHVDLTAPTLTLDPVTSDNVINAAEAGATLTVSGSSNAEVGQSVTVNFNGANYTTNVDTDGRWSVEVAPGVLTDGNITVSASVSDKAGNPISTSKDVLVDLTVPTVSIHTIASDDIINLTEHGQAQIVSGSSTGAAVGDKVTVSIGGNSYTTVLDASGNWSIGVPASVIGTLTDGTVAINVTITDAAGNVGSGNKNITVDTGLPSVSFNPIAVDNVLNAVEKGQPLILSGSSSQLANGSILTVELNGVSYLTGVDASGNWSVNVSVADLAKLGEANYSITASGTSAVGNSVSNTTNLLVDTVRPVVNIEPLTSDDVLNIAEVNAGQTLNGTVTGSAAGDTITVVLGGQTYTTSVQGDLTWSIPLTSADLTALGNGAITVSASVTNDHGNTGTGSRDFVVDANLPGLRVGIVAGDDIVNAIEHSESVIINGTSSGMTPGAALVVTVNGQTYNASVLADGSWLTNVSAADVSSWPAGQMNVTVAGSSAIGNPVSSTRVVNVDLSSVAIAINTVAGDNVLNAAEHNQALTLSGSTLNVEAGQMVKIVFDSHSYNAIVGNDGKWAVTVPAADMKTMTDGETNVQVSVVNRTGNGASAGQKVLVDITAPTVTVDAITNDNVINQAEAGADLVITGHSNAQAGQSLTLNLNGINYSTTVGTDGSWNVTVPAGDLSGLPNGTQNVSVSVSDKAGNPIRVDHNVLVDLVAPTVTINRVAGDDVINLSEHGQAQIVSGSSTGGAAGDKVTVTLDGSSYLTVLDASGNWSVGVPASVISGLADGTATVTATVTDRAGNVGSVTKDVRVDTGLPSLGFNAISVDNVLNAVEKGQSLAISGTSSDLADGSTVTVNLNGKNYLTTVDASGNWSVSVPAMDLSRMADANYSVTVSGTSAVGNSVSNTADLLVDSKLPSVNIDPVTSDDVLNIAEVGAGQTLSGTVSGATAGDTVTLILGGKSFTAIVQPDLTWVIPVTSGDLTALGNGAITVSASVTNTHGNTGVGSRDFVVDASLPGLRVGTVAGDDIVNAIEHGQSLNINGTSSGMTPGAALVVTVNGQTYNASVLADGSWLTNVSAADVSSWPAGQMNVTVAGSSAIGNPVSSTRVVTIDLSDVAVSINTIAGDNVLNVAEHNQALMLSGSTQNVEAGKVVNVVFADHSYSAIVGNDGTWRVTVPAADMKTMTDGEARVQVSVTNAAGNSASAAQGVYVDLSVPALTIDNVTSDNVLNKAEVGSDLLLSGTSTAEVGQMVTVTFDGNDYLAEVQANGSWSLNVPAADLTSLRNGNVTVSASASDKAGNISSVSRDVLVDITVPTVIINTVAGDDIINATEQDVAQTVSGSSSGAAAGDKVTLMIDGHSYMTVLDASGNWSVGVPASVVSGLSSNTYRIDVSITDAAGNTGSANRNVEVNTTTPQLSINTLAQDDVINAVEKGSDLLLSGASNLANGTSITVSLNGKSYTTTVNGGQWTLTVPAIDVAKLGEASYTVTAKSTDGVGNSVSVDHLVLVDSAIPVVLINPVTSDDVLNAAEIASGQTLSGRVAGAVAGDTVTVMLGGEAYITQVNGDLSWSVNVLAADLTALGNGGLTVSASVTNGHGNIGYGSRDIQVDANLPGLRIATVAGDDIINAIELGQNLIVSGTSSGLEMGSAVQVILNATEYTAITNADGSWSVAIPAAEVAALHAGGVIITASGISSAGNPVGIQHGITVDMNAVAVSINAVTGDNVLNAQEKGSELLLSGRSQNVETGQTVNVQFAGNGYTATVQTNGNWSVTVPSADLRTLTDGDVQVQVSVVNAAGNGASASQGVHVDLSAPALTIDNVTNDNVLNAAEVGSDLLLSGTSTAQAGQTVTVMLNGISYEAVVEGSGRWSTTVPAFDIARLAQGNLTVSASVNDQAGNHTQVSRDVLVDTLSPGVTIAAIAFDNIINATEHGVAQIVSGGSTRTVLGDKVSVVIDGRTYVTLVDASGNWSVGVPAEVINGLADNTYTVTATITDSAGNVGSASHQVVVNTQLPVLTINTLAQDDVINSVEKGQPLTISGTSTQIDGAMVSVTLNGVSYQAVVTGGGWSLNVPVSDVAKLGEAVYTLTASATDTNGNRGSVVHNLLVDSVDPSVVINTVTSDNVLNAQEVAIAQAISGKVVGAAAGDIVIITVGSNTYSAQVQSDLSWSINLSSNDLLLLGNGSQTITASVTNAHGNVGLSSHSFVIDANLPGLRVNTVSGDDVINSLEHSKSLVVTGTSEGFNLGDTINIVINGVTYQAAIAQAGNWLVSIPGADVQNFPAGELRVKAEGTNAIGNQVSNTHLVTVDLDSVAVSINTVATDDIINKVEKGQSLTLTGEVAGVEVGQTVTLNFGGQTFVTTVLSGNTWSYTVPVPVMLAVSEGNLAIAASVTNQAGNSSSSSHAVIVDSMPPILSINALSTDGRLNALEHGQPLTIAGNSNGLESGRTVTVTLNGNTYTATVGNDGSWTLIVPDLDVMDLPEGPLTVTVASSDLAGNPVSVQSNLLVDTQLPTVTINNITADNIINAAEHGQAQVITGTSDAVGQVISITIGGETYTTEVRIDKTWVIGVPSLVINNLAEGINTVHASVSDQAGNAIALDHQFEVASGLPSLIIDTVATDNIINSLEQGLPLTISGTASSSLFGQTVEVRLNDQSYTTEIGNTGIWSVIVPVDKLAELSDGRYQITASAIDNALNSANSAKQIVVDTLPPTLTVNTIAADDIINAQEQGAAVVLSGTYGNVESGQTIVVDLNGEQYQVTTNATGGVWSITVPVEDVSVLADGSHNVIVSLSDVANNTVAVTHPLIVDTLGPVVVIAGITGDDIITSDEQDTGISITGTTTAEAGQMLTVTFNDRNYVTTVNANSTWSVDVPASHFSGVIDGNYSVSVAVNDVAGNAGSASKEVAIFSQPPAIGIDVFAGDDRVNINEHGLLHYITGTSDALGQTVTVSLNGHEYIGQVSELGVWSVTVGSADMLSLSEGTAVISAQTTNTLGNSASTTRSIEVDLTAPVATVSIDTITTDTGLSSTDFVTADNTFTLSGHITGALGAGETAQISLDGGSTWQGLVLINDQWSLANQTALADGSYSYYVRVVDLAGNTGVITQQTVVVDTVVPEQAITIVSYTDNVGLYQGNFTSGTSTDDTSPVINGTLGSAIPESSVVRIYSGATLLGTATVSDTTWSFDLHDLVDGRYNLTAVITDLAGNEGAPSSTFSLTVDTIAPAQTATINSFTDDVGTLQETYLNGAATDDTRPLLNGSLSGAILQTDTVRIYQDDVFIGNAVVSGSNWTFLVPTALSDATTYKYTAIVTDVAGNLATPSAEFSISVDTTPPDQTATIVSYYDDVIEQVGEYGNNSYTNDVAPLLKGTLSAALREGEMLRIYQNGVLVGNATVESDLSWTLQLSGLADNTYTYTAVVSDAVGNEGSRSSGFAMTIDTIAPSQGTVTVNTLLTADTTPTITGTVFGMADGNRLQVKVNGTVYTYGVDAELAIVGTVWSLKISDSMAMNVDSALDAVYNVEARIADQAGNYFTDNTSGELTVYRDTAIIRSPSFDYMAETQPAFIIRGQPGTGEVLVVTIKDSLGNVVKVFNSNDGSMTQTEGGNWLLNSSGWGTSVLASGSYSVSSAVTIADGSGGQYSTVQDFTVIEPISKINAANDNDDSSSRVYATADGGYWMFWATGTTATGPIYNLQAQRYSQNGEAVGAVVVIALGTGQANNDYLQYIRLYDVYMKADGSFSVFYSANNNATTPYLQNYDVSGVAVGARVSLSNSQPYELTPTYVNMADGSYVLLYSSGTGYNYNVYSIRYNSAGVALDAASVAITTGASLNNGFSYTLAASQGTPTGGTTLTTTQGMSGVDVGDGKYAMVYMSSKPGSTKTDLYMKTFDFATGKEVAGSEIQVNIQAAGFQIGSNTVALKSGGFITLWASNAASATSNANGTMDGFDVYARRFNWDAAQQKMVALDSSDVLVNTTTNGVNGVAFDRMSVNMSVAALQQGGYVVVWSKFTANNKAEVYAQSFDAAGNKLGGETLISTNSANLDTQPSVTALVDGGYVVSWDHMTTTGIYWGTVENDVYSIIVNADGTIRGKGDNTAYATTASYLDGTSGTLNGDAAVNTLDGRHGAMTMSAGAGNDYILVGNTGFTSIDGGSGFDTLVWDSAANLNFSEISNKVTGIEAIHLGDQYANTLTLSLADVLAASDTTDVLVVQGGTTDTVTLTDSGWSVVGNQIWRGDTYQVLENLNDSNASLWVQQGINVSKGAAVQGISLDLLLQGSTDTDVITMDPAYETLNIGNGGHDTLLYKLLNSESATGGNIETRVNGFTVGSFDNTQDTDRIDISELLQGSGYTGTASASYTNGVATLDDSAGNIGDYITVVTNGSDTVLQIDRDGSGSSYAATTVVTLSGVQTDLATLLANHQLTVI